jgi:hypothetical protein
MKFSFRIFLGALAFSFIAGTGPGRGQLNDPSADADATDPAKLSPDDAARYEVQLVNKAIRAKNQSESLQFPDQAQLISQMAQAGFTNLLAFYQAEHPYAYTNFDRSPFVIEPARDWNSINGFRMVTTGPGNLTLDLLTAQALQQSATDADIPAYLQAASQDLDLIRSVIYHRGWSSNPKVIQWVKDEIAQLNEEQSGGADAAKGALKGVQFNEDQSSTAGTSKDALIRQEKVKDALHLLNSFTSRSPEDPALQQQFLTSIQNAAQNPVATGSENVSSVLSKCLSNREGTYDAYVPALFTALDTCLADAEKSGSSGMTAYQTRDPIYRGLASRPKFCGDPQVQAAVRHMFENLKDDPAYGTEATCAMALVGDQDSFASTMQNYRTDAEKAKNPLRPPLSQDDIKALRAYGVERVLFDAVLYRGTDDKLRAVIDNLQSATFDAKLGQWVVIGS